MPKRNIYINVVRSRMVRGIGEEYSLSKPCLHCSKILRQYCRKMMSRGIRVWVRYSLGGFPGMGSRNRVMSDWELGKNMEDGLMSSGWREKYRIFRNSS